MVVFPILFHGCVAGVANLGPIGPLVAAGPQLLRLNLRTEKLIDHRKACPSPGLGCAYGLSRRSAASASPGGRNELYFKVLFIPCVMLYDFPMS